MFDAIHLKERINARGALIKVLDKQHLDLTTLLGRGFIAFLSAMAEDERQRILKRANKGRAAARKCSAKLGRKPKLTAHQQAEALKRRAAGEAAGPSGKPCASITTQSRGWRRNPTLARIDALKFGLPSVTEVTGELGERLPAR